MSKRIQQQPRLRDKATGTVFRITGIRASVRHQPGEEPVGLMEYMVKEVGPDYKGNHYWVYQEYLASHYDILPPDGDDYNTYKEGS
jgi:hypothetical protein